MPGYRAVTCSRASSVSATGLALAPFQPRTAYRRVATESVPCACVDTADAKGTIRSMARFHQLVGA